MGNSCPVQTADISQGDPITTRGFAIASGALISPTFVKTLTVGPSANMRDTPYALFTGFSSVGGDLGHLLRSAFSDPWYGLVQVSGSSRHCEAQIWTVSTRER